MTFAAKFEVRGDITALRGKLRKFAQEAVLVTAGKVIDEFDTLLNDAPQRSGFYVASYRIGIGGRFTAGMRTNVEDKRFWPTLPKDQADQWYAVGSQPAITAAKEANAGIRARVSRYALKSTAIFPEIIVYNTADYAQTVDDMNQLRDANVGHEHAFARFKERLAAALSTSITPESGAWVYYRDRDL